VKYRLTQEARREVLEIWNYIAEDDEAAADRFIDLLIDRFEMLGRNPQAGRRRDDLRRGYRSFPVKEYLILYRVEPQQVGIMRVLHGRRDVERLLS
jgi:toxin ParE1/3/4